MLIQIKAPHFTAAYDMETGRIAPIIAYMRGWGLDSISTYCNKKHWSLIILW